MGFLVAEEMLVSCEGQVCAVRLRQHLTPSRLTSLAVAALAGDSGCTWPGTDCQAFQRLCGEVSLRIVSETKEVDHPEDEEPEESQTTCVSCQSAGRQAGSAVLFAPCRLDSLFLGIFS